MHYELPECYIVDGGFAYMCSRVRKNLVPIPTQQKCWPSLTLTFLSCETETMACPPHRKVVGIKLGDTYKTFIPILGTQEIVSEGEMLPLLSVIISESPLSPSSLSSVIISIPVHHLLFHHSHRCYPCVVPSSPLFVVSVVEIPQGDRHLLYCSVSFICEQIILLCKRQI